LALVPALILAREARDDDPRRGPSVPEHQRSALREAVHAVQPADSDFGVDTTKGWLQEHRAHTRRLTQPLAASA
jgi:hypothetical protein